MISSTLSFAQVKSSVAGQQSRGFLLVANIK